MLRRLLVMSCFVGACGGSGGESADATPPPPPDAALPDAPPQFPNPCPDLGLAERPFSDGPYGGHRGEIAGDFTLPLDDGTTWGLRERWSGCETYLFVPDTLRKSPADATSVWEADIDLLLLTSPRNAHYFFVSRATSDGTAGANLAAMRDRIDGVLAGFGPSDAAWGRGHFHVVSARAANLGSWLGDALDQGIGRGGLAIDRRQRVRGVGSLTDVWRYDAAAGSFPFDANLSYVAYEAQYMNGLESKEAALDAESGTVIPLWSGETLEEFAETDVTLPSAAEMATYDTLEIEIMQACPDANEIEFGNCGAWDYVASLAVQDARGANQEIARFITSYHRETHWIVDVSPMLALLRDGGTRHFRWDFAPPWNTQPTATWLSLRLSNRGKGVTPEQATFLFSGGDFNSSYDTLHPPVDVPIPADAQRVELFVLVTGHGSDDVTQCSEFCDHQHEITVGASTYRKEFPGAGTQAGCVTENENGMTPNQWGTWWYGRGGWCPGEQVDPWIVDVTSEVTPGTTATISYQGLYQNATPPDGTGNIDFTSYLVIYH